MRYEVRINTVRIKSRVLISLPFAISYLGFVLYFLISNYMDGVKSMLICLCISLIYPTVFLYKKYWKLILDTEKNTFELHRFGRKTITVQTGELKEITVYKKIRYQNRCTPYCVNYIRLDFGKVKISVSIGENKDGFNMDSNADIFVNYLKENNKI